MKLLAYLTLAICYAAIAMIAALFGGVLIYAIVCNWQVGLGALVFISMVVFLSCLPELVAWAKKQIRNENK